ncbi:MAG TPA: hypothetical protein VNA04_04030 [Thermoanaerobaculia bacterium]|nr:hypothetical protein [Thermoanaerobaculia bacterium]
MHRCEVARLALLTLLLAFFATAANAHLQGIWSGTMNVNDHCFEDGVERPFQWSSQVELYVFETGEDFFANLFIARVPEECDSNVTTSFVFPLFGTSPTMTMFEATMLVASESVVVSGTVSGTSMSLSLKDETEAGFSATGSLTQVDFQQPSIAHTGSWEGSFTVTFMCPNGTFSENGTLDGSIFHTGPFFSGIFVAESPMRVRDDKEGNCRIEQEPAVTPLFISAHVMGSSVEGSLFVPTEDEDFDFVPFTGTISGNAMSVNITFEDGSLSFTLMQTSTTLVPVISEFTAEPSTVAPGEPATLRWSTVNATSVTIDNAIGQQPLSGSVTVRPIQTTTYALTATGPGGSASATVTVNVAEDPSNLIAISRTDTQLSLEWDANGNTSFTVDYLGPEYFGGADPTCSDFPPHSNIFETPLSVAVIEGLRPSTWYHIHVHALDPGAGGSTNIIIVKTRPAGSGLEVLAPDSPDYIICSGTGAAQPRVALTNSPRGIVQPAEVGGGRDQLTISHVEGTDPVDITLSPVADFVTVTPLTFSLLPGTSQVVTIVGNARPAGQYQGSINVSGTGVPPDAVIPIRMLSADPPSGTVEPRATVARAEISTEIGQGGSGSVSFTNTGNATLQAIVVVDVPWITPESGIITIGPGQTVSVSFTVDPSKRPPDLPIGAATGKLSLIFIRGSGGGSSSAELQGGGSATSSVSVTLVYVVKPGVSQGAPPPLVPGELAFFAAGLPNKPQASGDLYLSNTQASSVSDLRLYFQGTGVAQNTTLPTLQGNSSVALPGLVKNLFGAPVTTGTTQVRSTNLSKVSVAATRTNTSLAAGTYSTALPVFRSDHGAALNEQIVLSGLFKFGTTQTDLFVQEVSGTAGSFQVEFLGESGTVVGSLPVQSISGFGLAEIADAGPANATAARITNSSGGRLAAHALVTNSITGDAWPVTDPLLESPGESTFVMPILSAGNDAETFLFATNRSATAAEVTLDVRPAGARRRRIAGKGTSAVPPTANAVTTVTLAPQQTLIARITSARSGHVRISGPAGAISAAGRSILDDDPSNVHGTGLPVVASGAALGAGQTKRFAGVDDASTASRGEAVPATFRNILALVETSGQSAKVRVTLAYTFSASALVSGQATSSREFTLAPSQYLLLSDLARDVIGRQRDSFGDLRNMTLDVEVIEGPGSVLPFLQSIDNGSGDSLVRTK